MKEYKSAAFTLMGRRTRNQDNFLLNGSFLDIKHSSDYTSASGKLSGTFFAAVVDGNGTKDTGDAASRLVCEKFNKAAEGIDELNDLSEAKDLINGVLQEANEQMESIVENNPNSKMGAGAAVLVIYGGKAIYGNVGDCAVYLRRDGVMKKLTTDHTEGEELVARGALTPDMLKNHSSRTKVTRMIGYLSFGQKDIMQFYDIIDVHDGDVFVLASPGIVQFMEAEDIDKGLQTCVDVLKSAERVVKAAHADFESKDNITLLVTRVNEEVDNVGSAKERKVKPIRRGGGGVRLHTTVNINPKTLLKIVYVAVIVLILAFSAIYLATNYPKKGHIQHINRDGQEWSDTQFDDTSKSDGIVSASDSGREN